MNKLKLLQVYKLGFGSEIIGYRFQEPDVIDNEGVFDIVVYVGVGSGYGEYSKDYTVEDNKIKDWKWLTVN